MKRFIKKSIIFISILTVILFGCVYLSHVDRWREYFTRITGSSDYIDASMNGADEIKPFILEVQKQNDTEVLVLGDSICHQMLEGLRENNKHITIAASNAAITMAGQYILAKEYLDNHPNAKEVYLVVHPTSMKRTFDTNYGYQYVVMPFSETGTISALDEQTIDICKKVYGDLFINPKMVYLINKSGMNRKLYLNMLQKYGESYKEKEPFEIANKYVAKIYDLCEERNVNFYLLASPVSEVLSSTCDELAEEYKGTWMGRYYPHYFESINYFSAEQAEDNFHFSGEYEEEEFINEKIVEVFKDYPLMEQINF